MKANHKTLTYDSDTITTNLYGDHDMKCKLEYALVAENAIIDSDSNKLTVVGLFSKIRIPTDGGSVRVNFVVAGKISLEDIAGEDPRELTVKIVKPNGKVLAQESMRGPLDTDVTFRAFFTLIEFKEVGSYHVKVEFGGEELEISNTIGSFKVVEREA